MRSYLISYLYTITCCFDLFSFSSCFLDNINFVKKAETKSYNRINIAFKFFLWPCHSREETSHGLSLLKSYIKTSAGLQAKNV